MKIKSVLSRRKSNYFGLFLAVLIFIFFAAFWYLHIEDNIYSGLENQISLHGQLLENSQNLTEENSFFIMEQLTEHHSTGLNIALVEEKELFNQPLPSTEWPIEENQEIQRALNELQEQLINFDNSSSEILIKWLSHRSYHLALPVTVNEENFWLLEVQDASSFNQEWYFYWMTLSLIFIMTLAMVASVYHEFLTYLEKPLKKIETGMKHLALDDYSYEYIDRSFPAVNQLGKTMTTVVQVLEKKVMRLYAGQQQLSLLLNNINLGVLVIDADGKIEMFNPAVAQILLLEPTAVGRSYQTVLKSFLLINLIDNVQEHGQAMQEEIEVFIPKSRFIDVNILSYQDYDNESEEKSILVLLYDISEIRRLEKVRTEFVANASHELRTPVTAIKGFAETLLSGAMNDPVMSEKFINIIATESNRLEMTISDILELSRIEKHPTTLRKTTFDLVKVSHNMVDFLSQKLEEKSITVRFKGDAQVNYTGEQHRIEQIMTNLIDNAINYSDIKSQITVTLKNRKKGVYISVADTGIGIPPHELDRIFERFYRVDRARSRNSGGTGLGLSIVRNLIQAMHGKLEVESTIGEGTEFIIYLPH